MTKRSLLFSGKDKIRRRAKRYAPATIRSQKNVAKSSTLKKEHRE
jgi:hypothetical protein